MAGASRICSHNIDGFGSCDIMADGVCVQGPCHAEELVEYAPVVHGRWDGEGDGLADGEIVLDVWYCSKCGHCIDDGTDDPCVLPNYCPTCGAKMDGGDTDGR